jgi:hypothetical protein
MVKSLNLGLKVKILGPLLAFMGVGGPARAQARVKGVTVGGWVGPQACKRYILLTREEASARSARPASRSAHNL